MGCTVSASVHATGCAGFQPAGTSCTETAALCRVTPNLETRNSFFAPPPQDTIIESYIHGIGAALEGIVGALGGLVTETIIDIHSDEVHYEFRWSDARS